MSAVSGFISLKFIQMLSKPFTKWKAYELGLIDKKGKKIRDAENKEEEKEFASWLNIIRKIKMMLNRFAPGGRVATLASFATALYLLKEDIAKNKKAWDAEAIVNNIAEALNLSNAINENYITLLPGKYIITSPFIQNLNLINITKELVPTTFLSTSMFRVKDTISGNYYTVAAGDLKEL